MYDPATGRTTGTLDLADRREVNEAVAAAAAAFPTWRGTSLAQRTKLMLRFRTLLVDHADDVAACITAEHGKTLDDARGEVARAIENVEYACGVADLLAGSYTT